MRSAADVVGGEARPGTLRRSVALLRAFRLEQTDPDHFYGLLARDSVRQVGDYVTLTGRTVLDVGGGPGYFAAEFARAGAGYLAVDADVGELAARGAPGPRTVLGSGMALPIRSAAVDVCYSSNVLEHVPEPERMAEEMLRVTRPGGTVVLSYTTWLSALGRPRDRALALPGRRVRARGATAGGTASSRRTGTGTPCSRCPPPRCCGGRATRPDATWWRPCRATTRLGALARPGSRRCARSLTWNLMLVLRAYDDDHRASRAHRPG